MIEEKVHKERERIEICSSEIDIKGVMGGREGKRKERRRKGGGSLLCNGTDDGLVCENA
jgi:hypothetical protein